MAINLQGFRRRQHRDVQVYSFELGYREWCEVEAAEGRRLRIVCDVSGHFVLRSKRANAAPKALVECVSSNVEVYEIREGDQERREKGQILARYNVGGILLDKAEFRKLMSELAWKELAIRVSAQSGTLLVG